MTRTRNPDKTAHARDLLYWFRLNLATKPVDPGAIALARLSVRRVGFNRLQPVLIARWLSNRSLTLHVVRIREFISCTRNRLHHERHMGLVPFLFDRLLVCLFDVLTILIGVYCFCPWRISQWLPQCFLSVGKVNWFWLKKDQPVCRHLKLCSRLLLSPDPGRRLKRTFSCVYSSFWGIQFWR